MFFFEQAAAVGLARRMIRFVIPMGCAKEQEGEARKTSEVSVSNSG